MWKFCFIKAKNLLDFKCTCGFLFIRIRYSFDADPVVAAIAVFVRYVGLQMMSMHDNFTVNYILF